MSEKRTKTPSQKREETLFKIVTLLGHTEDQNERFNVGYAHQSLAVFSSFIRSFEKRMAAFVSESNVTITEAIPSKADLKDKKILVGKSVSVNRNIFVNSMTLTTWINFFYQESPAINARARDDLRTIGENAFKVPALQGFQFGGMDRTPEADD